MTAGRGTTDALIGGAPAAGVGLSALLSAVVSYVVLLLAAHTLPSADNAHFLVYWALLFGAYGVVSGLYAEAARASYAQRSTPGTGHPRTVPVAVSVALVLSGVLGLSSPFWGERVLGEGGSWLVWVVLLAGVASSVHFALAGVLTAQRRWGGLIAATTCESGVRLASVLIATMTVGNLPALALASAVSAGAWVLVLGRRDVQAALVARGDAAVRASVVKYVQACAAAAATTALLVGFPVLVRLTTTPAEYSGAAGLLLGVILTRAPLMVPLNAYQGVALTYFLRHRHRGLQALLPLAAGILALTSLAVGLAAVAGPSLFALLVGGRYALSGGVLAGLTGAAGLLALLTLTGACCLALGRHAGYALGWIGATVVASLLLLAPLPLVSRTVLSLAAAPVVGCLLHVLAILTARRQRRSGDMQEVVDDEHVRGR